MVGGAGTTRHNGQIVFQQKQHDASQQRVSVPPQPGLGHYDKADEPISSPGQNPFDTGLGYDPSKPAKNPNRVITNTRMELPPDAYRVEADNLLTDTDFYEKYDWSSDLTLRPSLNTTGKAITIRVNQYKVLEWPQRDIYQYDVNIGNGAEKRGKIKAIWNSRAVQSRLRQVNGNAPLLWDGNKIAWSSTEFPEQRIIVDLDAEKGRIPRVGFPPDTCYVIIRKVKAIRMAVTQAYLQKLIPFDNSVLEAISFLDHAMRQQPSELYTAIKRSFFTQGNVMTRLDDVVYAMKGVYTSMRLCELNSSTGGPSTGLAVNVDVANGTFWISQDLHQAARNLCKERNRSLQYSTFRDLIQPIRDSTGRKWVKSTDFSTLSKMSKLKFTTKHRGKNDDHKMYSIKRFTFEPKEGGAHSKNTFFKYKNKKTDPPAEEHISVYDYFKRTYNITIQYWDLPLVVTTRDGMFPMELCVIAPNQRYSFKMSPEQTSAMIRFAVTRPGERIKSIKHGIGMLKWAQDPYLNHFGIKIDPNMTNTNARLLTPPEIEFAGKAKISPGTSGRWDLRGKKFIAPNPEPLTSWGVCIFKSCVPEDSVRNFLKVFIQTYVGHGGKVENKNPPIYTAHGEDIPDSVARTRLAAGNQTQKIPQILFYVLRDRNSFVYERLKRNNECRFAMVSQCLAADHVRKASPQYCSNVAMKVNAKLGGSTSQVLRGPRSPMFPRPTMIIGADVSHPAPGSPQASMAAITVSMDKCGCRFAAAVQTNGRRVEMISKNTLKTQLLPLLSLWADTIGGRKPPQHVYYFRDGVSEGQYAHVLKHEVEVIKELFTEKWPQFGPMIKFTVTVCSKRHHLRFFPKEGDSQAGDRNNNALPGTLVERDITHPFEYDFYLCSHAAIQGTARPVHYHVILDEACCSPNDFQKMIYEMSYQYMRSTTPVSIIPAVYYAHLASLRARGHEDKPASDGPRGGQMFEEVRQNVALLGATSSIDSSQYLESVTPLTPLGSRENPELMKIIRTSMWYI